MSLPRKKVNKPINVRFGKGKMYEMKKMALDVTLESGTVKFEENFILCEMDDVDLIFGNTFIEAHVVDVRRKPTWLIMRRDSKELALKLTYSPSITGSNINLVLLDQMLEQ